MNADLSTNDGSKGAYWCSIFGCLRLRDPAGRAAAGGSVRPAGRNRRLAARAGSRKQGLPG